MKTLLSKRYLVISLVFAAVASSAFAGPGVQYWTRTKPVTTTKEVEALKSDDTVVMTCGACKTVMIRDARHAGRSGNTAQQWFTVGTKHSCDHCGGEMTVANGKTKDSMQHNCSMCGEGAASCCVAMMDAPAASK